MNSLETHITPHDTTLIRRLFKAFFETKFSLYSNPDLAEILEKESEQEMLTGLWLQKLPGSLLEMKGQLQQLFV